MPMALDDKGAAAEAPIQRQQQPQVAMVGNPVEAVAAAALHPTASIPAQAAQAALVLCVSIRGKE
jgi:hypothetical protein